VPVPAELLTCPPLPAPPPEAADAAADPVTQRDVAGYVVDLYDVAADCRGKLDAVRAIVDGQ